MIEITIGTRKQLAVLVESSDEDREAVRRTQQIIEYFRRALESENDPDAMIRFTNVDFSMRNLVDAIAFLDYLYDALNGERTRIAYPVNGFQDKEAKRFGDNYSYINPAFATPSVSENEFEAAVDGVDEPTEDVRVNHSMENK